MMILGYLRKLSSLYSLRWHFFNHSEMTITINSYIPSLYLFYNNKLLKRAIYFIAIIMIIFFVFDNGKTYHPVNGL